MNILILSWRGPKHPNAGGAEISTHEHAKGWVKAGHQVTLFTSAFASCKKEEIIDGVRIIRHGWQIIGVHWEAFKWYLFGEHPKFDIVIDQFHGIPFFTPLYVRSKKLAFIHEVTKEVWRLNPLPCPLNYFIAFFGVLFEPLIFKLYKQTPFMTGSESTKNDLIAWGIPENNITVIHHGIIAHSYIKAKRDYKTMIFLGALSKDKGIEDALQIFSLVAQKNKKMRFWIVGKTYSQYLTKLRLNAKRLGISRKVKFWGFVNEKKKFELLSKSYIAINPSIREGWCMVVIEAASVGTPTVGYNVAGLRDSIIDNKTGLLSDPTPQSLAEEINTLLNNVTSYKKLQSQCVIWSKKFTWEKAITKSLLLILYIIDNGRRT